MFTLPTATRTTGSVSRGFSNTSRRRAVTRLPKLWLALAFEAELDRSTKYWTSRFPGELPETPVLPGVLNNDAILVEGQVVNLIHAGQGDIEGSTAFHVPSADAVISGDVVYNNVHMMMYEADETKREAWIASIDGIAVLNPKIVVVGHKSVGAPDLPENLAASKQYLARLHRRR